MRRCDVAKVGRLRAQDIDANEAPLPDAEEKLDTLRYLRELDERVRRTGLADDVALAPRDAAIIDEALSRGTANNYARIARGVGVHRSTVMRRVEKMLEAAPYLQRFWKELLGEALPLNRSFDTSKYPQLRQLARARNAAMNILHPRPVVERGNGQITIDFPSFAALWSYAEFGLPGPKRCPVCGRFVRARATYCDPTCRKRAERIRKRPK